tara:strand:- start:1181 stop:2068 length:888 start_codon:yes stop_codon:yes gene_type:complete
MNILKNIFTTKKPWVRWYSVDPGVSDLHPWFPARKLHRKWRTQALKDQGDRNSEERRCPYLKASRMWDRLATEMRGESKPQPQNYTHGVTCPAVTKVMDTGYILPLPADILIQTDGSGINFEWMSQALFNYGQNYVKAHIPDQTTGMRETFNRPVLDWTIKLELPWRVQAHKDVVFMQMPIPYWEEDRFSVPTGIADPSYSYEINLQLFWHKVEAGEYLLKAGTPLCQWVPMHRDFLTMKDWNVMIETANDADQENNQIMEYQRRKNFLETNNLKERIELQKDILKLNKNIERFN